MENEIEDINLEEQSVKLGQEVSLNDGGREVQVSPVDVPAGSEREQSKEGKESMFVEYTNGLMEEIEKRVKEETGSEPDIRTLQQLYNMATVKERATMIETLVADAEGQGENGDEVRKEAISMFESGLAARVNRNIQQRTSKHQCHRKKKKKPNVKHRRN